MPSSYGRHTTLVFPQTERVCDHDYVTTRKTTESKKGGLFHCWSCKQCDDISMLSRNMAKRNLYCCNKNKGSRVRFTHLKVKEPPQGGKVAIRFQMCARPSESAVRNKENLIYLNELAFLNCSVRAKEFGEIEATLCVTSTRN